MINLEEAKTEVHDIDLGVKNFVCCGKSYKIPMLNGDLIGQEELLKVADRYDTEVSGLPSEIAKLIGDFMYQILKLENDIDELEARKIANSKTVSKVYNLWLGI